MSFNVRPPDGPGTYLPTGRPAPATSASPEGAQFARVYELEEARRRRDVPLPPIAGDRIPPEVWDEVDAASRLVEDLARNGQRVMFDQDRLTGRVVASLLDEGAMGGGLSPLRLDDVVDPGAARRATQADPDAGYGAA